MASVCRTVTGVADATKKENMKINKPEDTCHYLLLTIKQRLKELEKEGRARFILDELGSGRNTWEVFTSCLMTVHFNEFKTEFDGFIALRHSHEYVKYQMTLLEMLAALFS